MSDKERSDQLVDVREILIDPTAIVDAFERQTELRVLKEWRAKFGHREPGENTILDEMDAAIAALEATGKPGERT